MALRVLLADESSTIKKVIQLTLQDFAVELKAIPTGLDVLPVARAFQPDIIFIDVLLPKKSGYEVAGELRKDPQTQKIPLVMMWSGFLQLDEAKLKAAQVNRKLEKPFEPEQLRAIVKDLVPKTATNPISSFLQFPDRPEFAEEASASSDDAVLNLDEPGEEFKQVPLHKSNQTVESQVPQDSWQHQDLARFKIDVPSNVSNENQLAQKYMIPEVDLTKAQVSVHGDYEEISFDPEAAPEVLSGHTAAPLNDERAEKILREEARKVLESVAWKIIPDMVERIVREEINKLLQDTEKSI